MVGAMDTKVRGSFSDKHSFRYIINDFSYGRRVQCLISLGALVKVLQHHIDKTIKDELIFIINYDKQNYPFCRFKLLIKNLDN